jgi:hypothetical protein
MRFFKFSVLVLLIPLFASARVYTEAECLDANYEASIVHKGFPFGLTDIKLGIAKDRCVITVSHEKLKFVKSEWVIDVCREPVHMKKGAGAVEVIKREGICAQGAADSYCAEVVRLKNLIQDDGLIFAEGEKENLDSDHGKVYCAFILLQRYLDQGITFSRHGGTTLPKPEGSPLPLNEEVVPPETEGSTGSF